MDETRERQPHSASPSTTPPALTVLGSTSPKFPFDTNHVVTAMVQLIEVMDTFKERCDDLRWIQDNEKEPRP